MEDNPIPPVVSEEPTTAPMSLGGRLFNIYASPGDVFDGIKKRPVDHRNWIVPVVIFLITVVTYMVIAFSQPAVAQKSNDKIRASMNASYAKAVSSGKLTQQQADDQIEVIIKSPFLKLATLFAAVFGTVAVVFLTALILWLIGKYAFKAPFQYLKSLELVGLATMITALGTIINMQLVVHYEDMLRKLGPSLLLPVLDEKNRLHLILSSLDIVSIWYLAILSLGLARLTSTSFFKPAVWIFGIWAVFTLLPILIFGGK